MSSGGKRLFGALLAGFVLLRLAILLANVEAVSNFEELFRGAIARDMISGLKWPLFDYQSDNYHAGSLLQAFLSVPFFKLLGPSLFALKLTPLFFFSLPSLALLFFWMRRHFGGRAAWTASVLYLFAPPAFIANSLYGMGFHVDSILFSMMVLICFYEYFFISPRLYLLAAAGGIAGFAVWLNYSAAMTLIACLSLFILKKTERRAAALAVLGACFMAGLAPWIFYNATHQAGGLLFLKSSFESSDQGAFHALAGAVKKSLLLLFYWVPMSLGFQIAGTGPGSLLNYAWYTAAAYAFWQGIYSSGLKNPKWAPLAVYLAVFIFLYAAAHGIPLPMTLGASDSRYFPPLHFFIILLVSAVFGRDTRKISAALAVMLFAGVLGTALFFRETEWGKSLKFRGYSFYRFSESRSDLWNQLPRDAAPLMKWFERYQEPDRSYLFWGFVQEYPFKKEIDAQETARFAAVLPMPGRIYWLEGLGRELAYRENGAAFMEKLAPVFSGRDRESLFMGYGMPSSLMEDPPAHFRKILPAIPEEYRKYFYFSLGSTSYDAAAPVWFPRQSVWRDFPEEGRRWFFRGAGACFSGFWIWSPFEFLEKLKDVEKRLPAQHVEDFRWGMGWGMRRELNEDSSRARSWLSRLPVYFAASARQGMDAYDHFYGASA